MHSVTSTVPGRAARARTIARAALVPRLVVPATFAVIAAWMAWQAGHVNSFLWLIDELLYAKYALGYAHLDGIMPTVHGVRYGPPNILYPVLLAPVWGIFPTVTAFHVAHVVNALAFTSTLFPTYLLARKLGARWGWALVAGVLAVSAPWAVTTTLLMTEALAYPLFMWAVYAIVLAVAEPSPRHDVLAGVAILAATLSRTQLILLAAVLVGAILIDELARREPRTWRDRLYPHRVLVGLAVGVGVLLTLAQVAGADLLSSYVNATNKPPLPTGWLMSALVHAARVFVGTGIVPALLFVVWIFRAGARPRDGLERAAVIVLGLTVPFVFYVAGFFAQNLAGGAVQERYVMYAVPLVAVGAVLVASDRLRPAPRLSLVAATVVVAMVALVEVYAPGMVGGGFGRVMSPAAAYFDVIGPKLKRIGDAILGTSSNPADGLLLVIPVVMLATLVAFSARIRRFAVPALFAAAILFAAIQTRWVMPRVITGIQEAYPRVLTGVGEQDRNWVDQALPDGKEAAILAGRLNNPDETGIWLWTEFWNKRITHGVARDGLSAYTGWPAVTAKVDPATGRIDAPGAPRHLVVSETSPSLQLEGRTLARAAYGAALIETPKALQARTVLDNADINGKPKSAAPMTLRVYGPAATRPVELTFLAQVLAENDPNVRLRFTVHGEGRPVTGTVEPGGRRTVTTTPRDGVLRIEHQRVKTLAPAGVRDLELTTVKLR